MCQYVATRSWLVADRDRGGALTPLGPGLRNFELMRALAPEHVILVARDCLGALSAVDTMSTALRSLGRVPDLVVLSALGACVMLLPAATPRSSPCWHRDASTGVCSGSERRHGARSTPARAREPVVTTPCVQAVFSSGRSARPRSEPPGPQPFREPWRVVDDHHDRAAVSSPSTITASSSLELASSSPDHGSSKQQHDGEWTSARARAMRCRCPRLSVDTLRSAERLRSHPCARTRPRRLGLDAAQACSELHVLAARQIAVAMRFVRQPADVLASQIAIFAQREVAHGAAAGRKRRTNDRISVLLPAPFGPSRNTSSPA